MTSDTTKAITVRMDEHSKEQIENEAANEELSLSDYIFSLIQEARFFREKYHSGDPKKSSNPSSELLSEIDRLYKNPTDYQTKFDMICKAAVETLLLVRSQYSCADMPDSKKQQGLKKAKIEAKYVAHILRDKS